MWKEYKVHKLIECDDFDFEVQEYRNDETGQQMLFMGLEIFRWAPSVYKELQRLFALFSQCVDVPLLAESIDDDHKWQKFVERFGFELSREIVLPDGERKKLYVYYNNKKKNNDEIPITNPGSHFERAVERTAGPA